MTDWGIKLEGQDKPFPLDDLSPAEVKPLSARYGVSWLDVISYPGSDLDMLADLCDLVAGKVGAAPVGKQATIRAARKLLPLLEEVASDLPSEWDENGNPQVGDETTSTSSGSPESSDGPLT